MTEALIFAAGCAYAAALWLIAARVARRRALALGQFPHWVILLCGCAALGVHAIVRPEAALVAAASLVGAIVCALVDARTGFIFDALSCTMIVVGCVAGALAGRLADGVLAAAVVAGALTGLYLVTGRRGIGLGDVKLGGAIALGYGLGIALVAIGSAFVLGALYAVVMIASGRAKRSDAVRFGPFLAGGAAIGLTAGALSGSW
jgi:leader peptidase (prepilin peptidase)/N-methyltransferase